MHESATIATMPDGLIELEDAQQIVGESCTPLSAEPVGLEQALGRTLAQEIFATAPVPAFESSAMDGYAVRSQDLASASASTPVSLVLVGESRAGHPCSHAVGAGEAVAISTGAMMPAGADAVLRVEDARGRDAHVDVLAYVPPGFDVRRAGDDVGAGERVLPAGARLGAVEVGVIASLGIGTVRCTRTPTVSILTTGDELVGPDRPLHPGQIHDSNGHTIRALTLGAGGSVQRLAHAGDDRAEVMRAVELALDADLTVICGGVSVGPHDHVKDALAAAGVDRRFWGVALRPGKPTWFGTREGRPVFALPGNPVSAMVTFILLAGEALRRLRGATEHAAGTVARLGSDYEKQPGRAHAVRCRLSLDPDGWVAHPTGPQGSHVLTSMLGAQALAVLPSASGSARAGERVRIEMLPPWVGWWQ